MITGTPVSGYGIALSPPLGWEAVIFRRSPAPGETTHPVVHAGNFALPAVRGDYGSGAVEVMLPGDIFFCLLEFHRSSAGQALFANNARPSQLTAADLSPRALQRALPGQAGVQRFFADHGRAFCLYLVVSGPPGRSGLFSGPNQLLQTLQVAPSGG